MNILIQSVDLNGLSTDIFIEGNKIRRIFPANSADQSIYQTQKDNADGQIETLPVDTVIDGRRKAIIPGLINMHTHAAMTLFRGFGDDMPLIPWLQDKIWPNEAKLTNEDVYWGAKLACLEMIRSGTTTFFDMYYPTEATAQAVEEMGLRAVLA